MTEAFATPSKTSPLQVLLKGLPTILVLAVMAVAWMFIHHLNSATGHSEEESSSEAEVKDSGTLVLPAGKIDAGQFKSIPVGSQLLQHNHTVPGRLRYDQTKHVDVRAPIDGILSELLVSPGQVVKQGDLLAVMRSPEIGRARAEILKRDKQRQIAQKVLDRELALTKSLEQLAEMLNAGRSAEEIESAFKDQPLGAYRKEILSAHSNMRLANDLIEKVRPLVNSGSVPGRMLRERENERQLAETAFQTARDQAKFAAEQARLKAEADVAEAERQLNLAWQAVETLLGYKENKDTANLDNEEAISRLEIRAPFSGSVESRGYAKDERIMQGDSIVVLANTSSLTAEASIRESDWLAVEIKQGAKIIVEVPALEGRSFQAIVRYFGREVQPETNSVPLVATIENREGLLRPGMFVRVTVPVGGEHETLAVKPESVIQHENQEFVFVEMERGVFKRCDIKTGQKSEDWVEVTEGLTDGQQVVTEGAFLLKSELLMQGEGD